MPHPPADFLAVAKLGFADHEVPSYASVLAETFGALSPPVKHNAAVCKPAPDV